MRQHTRWLTAAAIVAVAQLPFTAQAADTLASAGFDLTNLVFTAQPLGPANPSGPLYWFESSRPSWLEPVEGALPTPGGFIYGAIGSDWLTEPVSERLPVAAWPQATQNLNFSQAGQAQLVMTPTAISGRASVDAIQFQQMAQIASDTEGYYVAAGSFYDTTQPWKVVLAPHTQLTWSGTIAQFVSQDSQALNDLLTPFYRPDLLADVEVTSNFALALSMEDGLLSNLDVPEVNSYLSLIVGTSTLDSLADLEQMQTEQGRDFTITLINPTDNALGAHYMFELTAGVGTTMFQNSMPDPVIPGVPEPATWAFMGLGLLGLAAVRPRHQG